MALLLVTCSHWLWAQNQHLRMKLAIQVLDSASQPLPAAYGRLNYPLQKSIIAFGISNDSGRLYLAAAIPYGTDSLELHVSATAHLPFTLRIAVNESSNHELQKVQLKAAPNTLPNAVVVAPAQWQRGDTTFYRASSFIQNGDKKLKDVLGKLPGFDLSSTRGLLFKGRPVDKITIEGEEIFADKLELMISSFPVHVLEQIQAIENQTDDKLLKGLVNDNKIFVNLGLKKGKLSTAFGDTELTAGTADRYRLFPTVFGLYNSIKFGLILDYNSMGNGLSPAKLLELYKGTPLQTAPWPIQHSSPYIINNLPNERYIRNRLFDHRLQTNIPISKKLNSKTEINAVFDKQRQKTQTDEAILNGNDFLKRIIYSENEYSPAIVQLKEQLDWNIQSNQNLTTTFFASIDRASSSQSSIFKPENTAPDSVRKQLNNQWNAYQLLAKYSWRFTQDKALRISFTAGSATTPQDGLGFSADYPLIFALPSNLKYLHISRYNRYSQVDLTADFIHRKNGKVIYSGIQAKQLQLTPENNIDFSVTAVSEKYPYPNLTYRGQHSLLEAAIYRKQSGNIGNLQVVSALTTGLQTLNKTENKGIVSKNYWLLKASVDLKQHFGKQSSTSLTLDYNQGVTNINHWNELLLPNTIDQFARNANSLQPMQELAVRWNTNARTSKISSVSITAFARRNFTPTALSSQLQGFMQISIDSFTRSPLNTYGIFAFHTWAFTKRRFSLNVQGNFFNSRFYQVKNNGLNPGSTDQIIFNIEGQKTWKSNWMAKGMAGVSFLKLYFSSTDQLESKVTNVYWKCEISKKVSKWLDAGLMANQVFNNLGTANKATLFLADVYLKYHPASKPFDISLRCDNLFNEEAFQVFTSGQSGQSFTQVPLIGRNIFASFRLTF